MLLWYKSLWHIFKVLDVFKPLHILFLSDIITKKNYVKKRGTLYGKGYD